MGFGGMEVVYHLRKGYILQAYIGGIDWHPYDGQTPFRSIVQQPSIDIRFPNVNTSKGYGFNFPWFL